MIAKEIPILPRKNQHVINRPLEIEDLEIIFQGAGSWWLYYCLLLSTGLSCVVVANLVHLANPEFVVHRFRNRSDSDSGGARTPIPVISRTLLRH